MVIGESEMRLKALIGAPMRSEPYSGNDWTCLPDSRAASASTLEAVTAPCPPRACQRSSSILGINSSLKGKKRDARFYAVGARENQPDTNRTPAGIQGMAERGT